MQALTRSSSASFSSPSTLSASSTTSPISMPPGERGLSAISAKPMSLEEKLAWLIQENDENKKTIHQLTEQVSAISHHTPPAPGKLRLLSAFPLGKAISPKHVAGFISESGMLHPLMEIMHTASVLTLFTVQCLHSLKQLMQTGISSKSRVFHMTMAIVSACIVVQKLTELAGLHAFFPRQELVMQGAIIPLAAYYSDAPLETYIAKYLYTPLPSHSKHE